MKRKKLEQPQPPPATPHYTPAQLRRARLAVSALFFTNGTIFANIVPRFPEIKHIHHHDPVAVPDNHPTSRPGAYRHHGGLIEDAGSSWATLYVHHLGAPSSLAAIGYIGLGVVPFAGVMVLLLSWALRETSLAS